MSDNLKSADKFLTIISAEELKLLAKVKQVVKGMNEVRAVTDDFLEAYDQIEEAAFSAWPELNTQEYVFTKTSDD